MHARIASEGGQSFLFLYVVSSLLHSGAYRKCTHVMFVGEVVIGNFVEIEEVVEGEKASLGIDIGSICF